MHSRGPHFHSMKNHVCTHGFRSTQPDWTPSAYLYPHLQLLCGPMGLVWSGSSENKGNCQNQAHSLIASTLYGAYWAGQNIQPFHHSTFSLVNYQSRFNLTSRPSSLDALTSAHPENRPPTVCDEGPQNT